MKPLCRAFPPLLLILLIAALTGCGGEDDFSFRQATGTATSDGSRPLPQPRELEAVPVFTGIEFESPVFLTAVPGEEGLLAVVEQEGIIKAISPDGYGAAATMLDISAKVLSGGEQGLIGLAFDPAFEENGYLYVNYTTDPGVSIISRFTTSIVGGMPEADPESESILIEQEQPFSNHNGGMLAFGPDGMLYIGLGDGGSQGDPDGNGQDKSVLLGKILRIDVAGVEPYTIPDDNPFVDEPGARGELWAYGFRNPYRFSFDRETGDIWAGDVGERKREEVDLVVRGGNYGWNLFEGSEPFRNPDGRPADEFVGPVIDYGRSEGISVIGGYVYRGSAIPGYQGAYLFGDYGSGTVWALVYDEATGAAVSNTAVAEVPSISSFGEDADGEVYVISLQGEIYRLEEK